MQYTASTASCGVNYITRNPYHVTKLRHKYESWSYRLELVVKKKCKLHLVRSSSDTPASASTLKTNETTTTSTTSHFSLSMIKQYTGTWSHFYPPCPFGALKKKMTTIVERLKVKTDFFPSSSTLSSIIIWKSWELNKFQSLKQVFFFILLLFLLIHTDCTMLLCRIYVV